MRRRATLLTRGVAIVIAGAWLASADAAFADGDEPQDVDHVALAAKMIADGHYDRAEAVLSEVDVEAEAIDLVKLHTLRGVVYLEKQLYSASVESFEAAIAAGQTEPAVHLYLAHGYFGLENYEKCLSELDAAGASAREAREAYLMRAQSHWELSQKAQAVTALDAGLARFPDAHEMRRMKIFLLAELGLYQMVVELGLDYVSREGATEDDYLALGEALRAGRQYRDAQLLLERARLEWPESEKIAVQLAHSYLDSGRPAAAAMLFEDAARREPKYHLEAAELYKQAERIDRALHINARVSNQKKKLKQRLSLLLARERFEQIAAMTPVLSRLNLLADEDIRYALAFAQYSTGQFDAAERNLQSLEESRLFEAAVELRRAMDSCRQAGWECSR